MVDMRKEFPAQEKNRRQWVLDTVRENQEQVAELLGWLHCGQYQLAKPVLESMHKQDRDALIQPNGILTDEQIRAMNEVK